MKKSISYTLQSSSFVHTPGILAWAVNGARFKRDRPQMVKIIRDTYGLSNDVATGLVTGRIPYAVQGESVIFEVME